MDALLIYDIGCAKGRGSSPKLIAALIDLHFAEPKDKKLHDCSICPLGQKKARKCEQPGYENFPRPKFQVDSRGAKYRFCPGKATWSPRIVQTFKDCKRAYLTGILPHEKPFSEQSTMFVESYPMFVEIWKERNYARVWSDVNKFTEEVFKAIGKMFGGKK